MIEYLNTNVFSLLGNSIFFNTFSQECKVQNDPFRTPELNQKDTKPLTGAPAKATAKPRKPSRILREIDQNKEGKIIPSIQKRKTNQIRKAKRGDRDVCYIIFWHLFLLIIITFLFNIIERSRLK